MRTCIKIAVAVFLAVSVLVGHAFAQGSTLTVQAIDKTSAVLPGVAVTITPVSDCGESRTPTEAATIAMTDGRQGVATFPAVEHQAYRVEAKLTGFITETTCIRFERAQPSVQIALMAGLWEESVTSPGSRPVVDVAQPRIAQLAPPPPENADVKRVRQAASDGDAHAQFALGLMYETGESVSQDHTEAVRWYRVAAEHGEANAQFRLGLMCVNGTGVPRDDTQALQWFRKAAEQGHAEAQYAVGVASKDEKQAYEWFRQAAEQGLAPAQYSLGLAYESGKGVARSDEQAARWYQKAADQGEVNAQYALGVILLQRRRCHPGPCRSREMVRKGCGTRTGDRSVQPGFEFSGWTRRAT